MIGLSTAFAVLLCISLGVIVAFVAASFTEIYSTTKDELVFSLPKWIVLGSLLVVVMACIICFFSVMTYREDKINEGARYEKLDNVYKRVQ
jgi:ABC-type dipeptide/oligopeptide/nickel transport system permease component